MKIKLVIVTAMVLLATGVDASVRSKMLYSRGVLELNAGNQEAALELFDQAVEADPQDGYALFYRGLTRGQLGDDDGAIADLTAALNAQPTLTRASLELGIALVKKQEYDDAIPFLERARKSEELDARASFFLGVCRLRRGEYEEARALFDRASTGDPTLAASSRYYEGIIAYREGKRADAIEHFQAAVDGAPDSQIAAESKTLIDALQATARPWQLYAATGFQYDSNVLLGPGSDIDFGGDGTPEFTSGAGDGRAVFNFGGNYRLLDYESFMLTMGYDFYQSLHFGTSEIENVVFDPNSPPDPNDPDAAFETKKESCCSEFDIQNHGVVLDLFYGGEYFDTGLLGRFDFALKQTDKFLSSGTVLPWVSIPTLDWSETQLSYRLLINDFYGGDLTGEDFDIRDGYNHAAAIREVFDIGATRYLWLGYRFDLEDPVGDDEGSQSFGYQGHQVETGFAWTLPSAYGIEAGYAYRNERYNSESRLPPPSFIPDSPDDSDELRSRRSDNVHSVFVLLHIPLPSVFELTCGVFSTFNNSNQAEFEYERLVGTISVGARL